MNFMDEQPTNMKQQEAIQLFEEKKRKKGLESRGGKMVFFYYRFY